MKGLGLAFPPHWVYYFSRKIFFMSYSINWPSFILWLLLLLETLDNFYIATICCPVCDVINFEINLGFFIKPFFYKTKKSWQSLNISRTKKNFNMKQKAFFIVFKVLSLKKIKTTFLECENPTLKAIRQWNLVS